MILHPSRLEVGTAHRCALGVMIQRYSVTIRVEVGPVTVSTRMKLFKFLYLATSSYN